MNKIFFRIKHCIKQVLRLLYGFLSGDGSCVVCGKSCFVVPLCKHCLNEVFDISKILSVSRCENCGKELLSSEKNCLRCRKSPVMICTDKVIPLFSYRLWNKELLYIWKIKEIRSLSFVFAKLLVQVLREIDADCIVPVPPRPGKIKQKGWDQVDELCEYLQYWFGFRVLKLLKRETVIQQKKLNRMGRLENIGKSYHLKNEKELSKILNRFGGNFPKKIILLDDVTTTGSTLESCSKILKEAGVETVIGVTLFIVD